MKILKQFLFLCLVFAIITAFAGFTRPKPLTLLSTEAMITGQAYPILQRSENGYIYLGYASWYSRKSPGIKVRTANNEIFNDTAMTCAIWGIPFDSKVKVTNLHNGKSIVLRVNDRGPNGRYFLKGRIIDLTHDAFRKISNPKSGLIKVKVEVLDS